MLRPMLHATLVAAVSLSLGGCLPDSATTTANAPAAADENAEVQATANQLAAKIKEMAATPEAHSDSPERHILTQQLAMMGPTTLAPLIDFMAAPETPGKSRLFILQCVTDYLSGVYMPNLKPMLESKDASTRAMGVMALAHVQDPSVVQLLTFARSDAVPQVSFAALSGLAMQGDAAARQEMRQMYLNGTTIGDIRVEDAKREVVRVLLRNPSAEDLAILTDALNQPFIAINARYMIAEALGRMGDKTAIPLLEQSLNLQTEPEYGEMVKQAVAAINERGGQA